jgi:hypothetical protein
MNRIGWCGDLLLKLSRRIAVRSGSTVSLIVQIYDTRSETFAIQRQRFEVPAPKPSKARDLAYSKTCDRQERNRGNVRADPIETHRQLLDNSP